MDNHAHKAMFGCKECCINVCLYQHPPTHANTLVIYLVQQAKDVVPVDILCHGIHMRPRVVLKVAFTELCPRVPVHGKDLWDIALPACCESARGCVMGIEHP